jgi:exodeoxyribonuclease V alpha subunit
VVIPLTTQHYPMLQRNLVYTGVTRGKRLVVLVGQRKALAIAVKGARTRRRWSKLREWLSLNCREEIGPVATDSAPTSGAIRRRHRP